MSQTLKNVLISNKRPSGWPLIARRHSSPKLKFWKFQPFTTDRVMIADLRIYIACRGGIWYFSKHKALKLKRSTFFLQNFKVGHGTIDLGDHQAT